VTDGVEGKPYEDVRNVAFTPDGKHIIYCARRGSGWVVVVDSTESVPYDEIVSFPYGDELTPDSLTMLARRGTTDIRVAVTWSAARPPR
jgi:hypothetical protein